MFTLLSTLSAFYINLGDNDKALTCAIEAISLLEATGHGEQIAYSAFSLGVALFRCGNYRDALQIAERGLQSHHTTGTPFEVGCSIIMSNSLREMGEAGRALETALHARTLIEGGAEVMTLDVSMTIGVYKALGKAYLKLGRLAEAEDVLTGALRLAEAQEGVELRLADLYLVLATLAHRSGEEAQEEKWLDRILSLRNADPAEQYEAHRMYAELLEKRGELAEAITHYKEYHRIRTESAEAESARKVEQMQLRIEMEKQMATTRVKAERMEHELDVARSAQMSMLPAEPPRFPGLEIAAHCQPALEVGGDYFDFIRLGEHRLGILIADVTGKGMPAALHMTLLKGVVRSFAMEEAGPREVLLNVNRHLHEMYRRGWFASMIYAVIDVERGLLRYATAGHNPLLLLRGGEQIAPTGGSGVALGLADNSVAVRGIEEREIALLPGDMILLYTDGVTEAMNREREEYGEERLLEVLERLEGRGAAAGVEMIRCDVEQFTAGAQQHDDMTMVLLKIGEAPRC